MAFHILLLTTTTCKEAVIILSKVTLAEPTVVY